MQYDTTVDVEIWDGRKVQLRFTSYGSDMDDAHVDITEVVLNLGEGHIVSTDLVDDCCETGYMYEHICPEDIKRMEDER